MRHEKPDKKFESSIDQNVPLAPFTTLGIGGPARYFAEATTSEDLLSAVAWAQTREVPLFVLGGGSNIVVADEGFPGLVVRLVICGVETRREHDYVIVTAGAGEEWDSIVATCVANGWAGFECLSGIPGKIGATPIQNVGAYGQETSETLVKLQAVDLRTVEIVELNAGDCEFGYRTSRFKTRDRGRFIITSVTYRLLASGKPAIRYAELERFLTENGTRSPQLSDVREAVLTIRRRKAMVIDPSEPDSRSVGSFFVNPVVSREELSGILARASDFLRDDADSIPSFPASNNRVKLSAAWLIEHAGFRRGYVHGNVGTSTKHALAIINRGGGTAREVAELCEQIRARVRDVFGVTLIPEPVFVGFDYPSGVMQGLE